MFELIVVAVFTATLLMVALRPQTASAHCDTMDGPTAKDGVLALETGELAHAMKWVMPDGEVELKEIFDRALDVRGLGQAPQQVADRWFLENLVRIHRAGEGASYTGLRPKGVPVDEKVAAADLAVAQGDLEPLVGVIEQDRWAELERRFAVVLERRDYNPTDVDAARHYVEAYVNFFKFAEGHDHDHAHDHAAHAVSGHGH